MTELTELEKAVAMDTALYDEIESLLPKDGVIDDTCSLINELMYLIKRREMSVRESTEAMALAGARSIGNTIHTDNHLERARECWRAMWTARDGIMEPVPRERRP